MTRLYTRTGSSGERDILVELQHRSGARREFHRTSEDVIKGLLAAAAQSSQSFSAKVEETHMATGALAMQVPKQSPQQAYACTKHGDALPPPPPGLSLFSAPATVTAALASTADGAAFDAALDTLSASTASPYADGSGEEAAEAVCALAAAQGAAEPLARAATAALTAQRACTPGSAAAALPTLLLSLLGAATGESPSSACLKWRSLTALGTLAAGSAPAATLLLSLGAAPALLDSISGAPAARTLGTRRAALQALLAAVKHSPAHALAAAVQGCAQRLAVLSLPPYAGHDAASDALVAELAAAVAGVRRTR